jgi:hypothetical protein
MKRDIIKTLLQANRRDLAVVVAYEVEARAPLLKWSVALSGSRYSTGPAQLVNAGKNSGVVLQQGNKMGRLIYPGDFAKVNIEEKKAKAAQNDLIAWLKKTAPSGVLPVMIETAGQWAENFQFVAFRPILDAAEDPAALHKAYEKELVGQDIWGKYAMVHFFRPSLRLEEYPPGGKTRGVKVGIATYWDYDAHFTPALFSDLKQFAKAVKTQPYAKLVEMLRKMTKDHGAHFETSQQRGVDAPNPKKMAEMPKGGRNSADVEIDIRGKEREILLQDLRDRNNMPRAFTQGPRAFELALKHYPRWKDMSFYDITRVWNQVGVKYHSYMGMD